MQTTTVGKMREHGYGGEIPVLAGDDETVTLRWEKYATETCDEAGSRAGFVCEHGGREVAVLTGVGRALVVG